MKIINNNAECRNIGTHCLAFANFLKTKGTLMNKAKKLIIPSAIFAAGLALAILGIMRGELREIMQKAVVVCLECIGI